MDIMKAILDIENKAQTIMGEMGRFKVEKDEEIKQQLLKIEDDIKKDADKRIADFKREIEEKQISELEMIERYLDEKSKYLLKVYEDNNEAWAQEIFDSVVRNEDI